MSGDMMQTLSGSSLLSLSFGTLPAVKAGMNLDANPFASQLALMTGPEAAFGSGVLPAATVGEGEFALALAEVVAAPVAARASDAQLLAVDPVLAKPIGAAVAAPRTAPLSNAEISKLPNVVADADIVAALPADATPSQIIEAVMNGTVAKPVATAQAQPVAVDADVPAAPTQPAPRAVITAPKAPMPPVIADMQKLRPQPMSDVEAAADVIVQPEVAVDVAAVVDQPVNDASDARVRRPAKEATPDVAIADPAIIAPVVTPVTVPTAAAPKEFAPDSGTTRVAVSAKTAPITAPVGNDIAATAPGAYAAVDTATPTSMPAAPQTPVPAAPAAEPAVPVQVAQPTGARAEPVRLAASAPAVASPQASTRDIAPPIDVPKAASPGTVEAIASAPDATTPAAVAPATPAISASAAVSTPAGPTTPANVIGGTPATPAIPATVTTSAPAAPVISANISAAASVAPQPARAAAPAVRSVAGVPSQRAVQAAVQSPQPAQALAALFNLGDGAADPFPVEGMTEASVAPRIEAVQPSWVAALNAVTSPVTSPAVQALTAPAAATAAQAPLETLAFDAAFIGNVETQISRVMGGGQMVRMQIMPEHLGRIDIEMLAGPDRDQVRLVTEHDAVRDTLVQSQVRLEQDLRQNGQRHADVTVELRQQSAGTQGGSTQQQRGQAGSEGSAQRDAAQRQNAGTASDTPTPAQRRPRGNVRYA